MCQAGMIDYPLWSLRDQSSRHVLNPYIDLDVGMGIFSTKTCLMLPVAIAVGEVAPL